jgi:hypothetical protein
VGDDPVHAGNGRLARFRDVREESADAAGGGIGEWSVMRF